MYHNGRFKEEAEKRGLECFKTDKYGWNTRPGEKVIEYALSNDWSDIIIGRNSLIYPITVGASGNPQTGVSIGGGKRPSSTRKLVCPCCGNSVRATKTVRIMCMDCMVQMQEI